MIGLDVVVAKYRFKRNKNWKYWFIPFNDSTNQRPTISRLNFCLAVWLVQLWRTVLFTGLTAATVARTIDIGAPCRKNEIGKLDGSQPTTARGRGTVYGWRGNRGWHRFINEFLTKARQGEGRKRPRCDIPMRIFLFPAGYWADLWTR